MLWFLLLLLFHPLLLLRRLQECSRTDMQESFLNVASAGVCFTLFHRVAALVCLNTHVSKFSVFPSLRASTHICPVASCDIFQPLFCLAVWASTLGQFN